jgi:hypothetical protein
MSGVGEELGVGELLSAFRSTTGGVMTEEVGAVTGDLELLTRPTPDGAAIKALVRYAGARDLYTVSGSPVRAVSDEPSEQDHRAVHDRILERLTTPGPTEYGNELPADLLS